MFNGFFNSASQAVDQGAVLMLKELIGSGNDRDCWLHPDDYSLCIKVNRPDHKRPQNRIDWHYACHLARLDVNGYHIPRAYGWVNTDKGPGLVFDLVRDFDGRVSKQLLQSLRNNDICQERAKLLVKEAFGWLIDKRVILADFGINNLLVQNYELGKNRLVIVDGLGARNLSFKYWFQRRFTLKAVWKAREFKSMTLDILKNIDESK